MEDLIGFIIFFVVFVLGPLLEHARKKNQPPPPPKKPRVVFEPQKPKQAPTEARPRPPLQGRKDQPRRPVPAASESATTMVPDELWQVLTGQPKPAPAPLPPDVEAETFEDEEAYAEDVRAEAQREEAVSLETMPARYEPTVVSLETVPDPRGRHVAFHKKIEQPIAVEAKPAVRVEWLQRPQDLRRAFILQAILGTPKGLE